MAKEADLKFQKIELKVSVNCCDGCKRKVKKALIGIEGVLKTEIDPLQPKVTVFGNVDPQILMKRLLKAGKQAELWSSGNPNAGKEKKEADMPVKFEKEKSKPEWEQAKTWAPCAKIADKIKESNNGRGEKDFKEEKAKESPVNFSIPDVIKTENPVTPFSEVSFGMYPNTVVRDAGNVRTQAQYCYMVEPYPVAIPYYAIPSYPVHHQLPHPTCCGQGYCCQAPETRVGDYFSDENTVGCSVM